ncbi:MAG: hypothetical protein AVDCRST_MAG10-2291 [uncultured Acidimicrobiales bacterium]|uniref:DUF427 domain-containing protein n=1 Tax=uncultured Acidimicrobiales bacterium TaxID=310071 RepID=A0A6J4IH53_9ACTN|nr:MAG: hypothetical protein AVDCRST_MAG10-2291 [uncultured Acidimicrobiales bacterium]
MESFDIPLHGPRVEPTPRWVRVRAGDVWVADSRRALLLAWYGPDMLPTYCFPPDDVRADLFRPSAGGGSSVAVAHDVQVGDVVLAGAAMRFGDPGPPLSAVEGHWSFTWDGRVSWFEEALEVHVHARDPSKRVDVVPSEREIRVEVAGQVVAESTRPHALFETGLPTRWYLPVDDVASELLEPSDTVSQCPYKGTARYWSVRAGGEVHRDLAWSYAEPVPECPRIAGLVCFFNEKVDLVIDGVPQPRPFTPWS